MLLNQDIFGVFCAFLDIACRDGKIYQECGTACPMTCENVRSDELIGCPSICVQGCFCPPGSVLDSDGMCVKQRQCGCLYDADGNGQKEYYQVRRQGVGWMEYKAV